MRVAIDTNGLYTTQAGVARHIRGLLHGLKQLHAPELEYREFAWPVENFGYGQPHRAAKTFYREFIWSRAIAPRKLLRQGAQVHHTTGSFLFAPPRPVRCVITLHDLAVLRHPERFRPWHRWVESRRVRRLDRGDKIICISRFTAEEAMRWLHLPAQRIEVIYNGGDFHPNESPPAERKPDFAVPDEFFLFVGSLEPGKNLSLLGQVYQLAQERRQALAPLVIVGARWAGVKREDRPPEGWQYLGRQPDAVLIYLYRRALALVFPSKYEGFGLPVAEAMALGCPVICSPVASLPEVGGPAACMVEMEPGSYLAAMKQLASEANARQEYVQKGREQARKFSWRKCASEVVEIYRQVLR